MVEKATGLAHFDATEGEEPETVHLAAILVASLGRLHFCRRYTMKGMGVGHIGSLSNGPSKPYMISC